MELNLAPFGAIFPVRISLHFDAVLAIFHGLSVPIVLVLTGLAYCLHNSSFEQLFVAGI